MGSSNLVLDCHHQLDLETVCPVDSTSSYPCLGYDVKDLSLKLEGFRPGVCGHGSCLVTGHMVPSRVAGVAVGGRDLN